MAFLCLNSWKNPDPCELTLYYIILRKDSFLSTAFGKDAIAARQLQKKWQEQHHFLYTTLSTSWEPLKLWLEKGYGSLWQFLQLAAQTIHVPSELVPQRNASQRAEW